MATQSDATVNVTRHSNMSLLLVARARTRRGLHAPIRADGEAFSRAITAEQHVRVGTKHNLLNDN